jgi:hypothetical protein
MNENDLNKLENHIDEPIKKCVAGMALLGFMPIFSCCGFRYNGEKIRKDHLLGKPYIYLDAKKLIASGNLKATLLDICHESRWNISIPNESFIDFHGHKWTDDHPWNAEGCLHKPEQNVLSLNWLEQVLERYKKLFSPSVEIRDGNDIYKNDLKLKHWQYEPSEAWHVTIETFDNL